jgi:hypothetical protein
VFPASGTYGVLKRFGWRVLPLLLALNYFCFRTELFGEENEKYHPVVDKLLHGASLSLPSLNWETFDKDNAPKAIRVEPWLSLQFLTLFTNPPTICRIVPSQFQPIRDKSPPESFL